MFDIITTSAILGCYLGLVFLVALLVTWAAHGYYLPFWARCSGYAFAALVIAGGLALSLFEYFHALRSDRAIIFFSLAYWVITFCVLATGITRLYSAGAFATAIGFGLGKKGVALSQGGEVARIAPVVSNGPDASRSTVITSDAAALATYAPQARLYYSALLFPVFRFDPTSGALIKEHNGPALLWASAIMALIWGTLAMVFVVPSWAGVMVTNLVKVAVTLYVTDSVSRSSSDLETSVSLLLDAEPCINVPLQPAATDSLPLQTSSGGAVPVAASTTRFRNPLISPRIRQLASASMAMAPSAKVCTAPWLLI